MRRRRSSSDGKNETVRGLGISAPRPQLRWPTTSPDGRCAAWSGSQRAHGRSADYHRGFGLDEMLQHPLQTRTDGVGHLARLERGKQLGQVKLGEDHRWLLFQREPCREHVETPAGGPPTGGPLRRPTPPHGTPTGHRPLRVRAHQPDRPGARTARDRSFGAPRSVAGRRHRRRSGAIPTARRLDVLGQMICARVLARSAYSQSARDRQIWRGGGTVNEHRLRLLGRRRTDSEPSFWSALRWEPMPGDGYPVVVRRVGGYEVVRWGR
jgi:hypothetical protein